MTGTVTDIQRFSLNDGDGIRTTVFLKGCNMRCTWCHNPETLQHKAQILFYETNCIGCGKCISACPTGAQKLVEGVHVFDRARCIGCGKCADVCFAGALRLAGKEMTTQQVMNEVRQDQLYYKNSGGGVTISGGEVFCQRAFADSIIDACRAESIPVAIETNLLHDFAAIEPLLRKTSLVMFDIKLMDSAVHKQHTGMDNRLILDNAKKLDKLGIPVVVRTPLIPGVTDTDENLLAIAEFATGLSNLRYYELLNFNPLGESKYRALGAENIHSAARPLSEAKLEHIRGLLRDYPIRIS